jgi:hypothetical protein
MKSFYRETYSHGDSTQSSWYFFSHARREDLQKMPFKGPEKNMVNKSLEQYIGYSWGDYMYKMIVDDLLGTREEMIYLCINCELNRMIGFEGGTYDEHAFHGMFILFINENPMDDPRGPNIKLSLQNSWGEDLADQELTIEQFKEYINDGSIYGFTYFSLHIQVNKGKYIYVMGGSNNNKTKKRLKKSNRRNNKKELKKSRRQNKKGLKKSRRQNKKGLKKSRR